MIFLLDHAILDHATTDLIGKGKLEENQRKLEEYTNDQMHL